jgi:hypothetical protein
MGSILQRELYAADLNQMLALVSFQYHPTEEIPRMKSASPGDLDLHRQLALTLRAISSKRSSECLAVIWKSSIVPLLRWEGCATALLSNS